MREQIKEKAQYKGKVGRENGLSEFAESHWGQNEVNERNKSLTVAAESAPSQGRATSHTATGDLESDANDVVLRLIIQRLQRRAHRRPDRPGGELVALQQRREPFVIHCASDPCEGLVNILSPKELFQSKAP